jgi:hypothetical protein
VPESPSAVAVYYGHGGGATAALDVAAQLAAARHLELFLAGDEGRRARSAAAELTQQGIHASSGPPPEGALVIASEDSAATGAAVHLTVRAGSGEDIEERHAIGTPVSALEPGRQQ